MIFFVDQPFIPLVLRQPKGEYYSRYPFWPPNLYQFFWDCFGLTLGFICTLGLNIVTFYMLDNHFSNS